MKKITGEFTHAHVEPEALGGSIGRVVALHGSIYNIRQMSGFAFVILETGRHLLQCVYSPEFARFPLDGIRENMHVAVTGEVVADERSRSGYEIRLIDIRILSVPAEEMPFPINQREVQAQLDTMLDYRPITLRNAKQRAIFKIQEGICRGFREFLLRERFTEIHTPKIVYQGAEGGANIFALKYFDREAYLAQSPQFYKQMMVGVFERVFEIAPVFRAEKHDTSRHINEYTSVDLEMGYIESFEEICHLEVRMIRHALAFLRENYSEELALWKVDVPEVSDIPALRFGEAKELVSRTFKRPVIDFEDFEPEEEKLLSDIIKKETGGDFVFVTHYKSSKRPFYAQDDGEEPLLTNSFDLLFRGMEVTTGGQRIHDYREQVEKMRARGMHVEAFSSYLMAHKYGLPPHGGLGLGLERFTARLLGLNNVRYATLFPRDIGRLTP